MVANVTFYCLSIVIIITQRCFCSKGNRTLHEDQIVLQATYSGSSGRESAALESETSTNIA
jgi:hypothetical protein